MDRFGWQALKWKKDKRMRQIIVVKVGSTTSALRAQRGDFEDWILYRIKLGNEDSCVVDVRAGASLPAYERIAGVVVTGSHDMVTEHQDWSERTAEWLAGAVERAIPVLGICYGHQLLAYALGGEVGNNPKGWEFGTVDVYLEDGARDDPLLGGFSSPIQVQASHFQSVLRLPTRAQRLAYNAHEPNHAFVVAGCAWGVQFHPEFDAEVVQTYLREEGELLLQQGQDPAALAAGTVDTWYGPEILRRFGAFVRNRKGPSH